MWQVRLDRMARTARIASIAHLPFYNWHLCLLPPTCILPSGLG
jgi:hypothetical protein